MKKLFLCFLVLCMGFLLTACQSGRTDAQDSESPDAPLTVDGEQFPPLEELSSAPNDIPGQEIPPASKSEEIASEISDETDSGRYGPKTGKFARMMASGRYRMQFDVKFIEDSLDIVTSYDMALSDDRFYMRISVDNPDNALLSMLDTFTILRDGTIYVFNISAKTYVETSGSLLDAGAIGVKGLTFVESGQVDGLTYEEYTTSDGGTLRFYVEGERLVRFSSASEDRTLEAENVRLTADVPESLFEIPSGYQKAGS